MKCPVDNETLVMTERSGVEIDYCPRCRGVWLDRGELDKLIEKNAQAAPAAAPVALAQPPRAVPAQAEPPRAHDDRDRDRDRRRRHDDDDDDDDYRHGRRGRRRESFLSELFDF